MLNKTYALVTGASSGLGVDFATILAEQGHNLILVARRQDRLMLLKDELQSRFAISIEIIGQDLALPDAAQTLYDAVRERGLQVDILINNAGYGVYGLFQDIPWEREATMMQLDMVTLVHLTKLFSRDMVAAGNGFILQVASIGAYQPCPTYASYAAAKSFVLNFSEALNYELKGTGVSSTAISPGITATEFLKVSGQKATMYQRMAMMQSRPVAEIGIRAMFKRKASVIPGLLNKLTAISVKVLPRWMGTMTAYMTMKSPETELGSVTT